MSDLRLYRPANGSEGDWFQAQFCDRCECERAFQNGESASGCEILLHALVFDTDDGRFPHEWRYNEDEEPTCTAFDPRWDR